MKNRLVLLGPVCLTGPDKPFMRRATQQRRLALLAALASSPGASISRDRLLGLLWPDRDEHTARHLLADSLYVLRRSLGQKVIIASGEALQLSEALVWTDVGDFQRALANARWSVALAVYRGDFLDGFHLRNAAEFDQWALAERSRVRALATRAASELTNELEAAGRIPEAVTAAERALELGPCDEAALRRLVRLLIAANNRARANAVARGFVEHLALEIGVSPSTETLRLVGELGALGNTVPIVVVTPDRLHRKPARTTDSVTESIILQGRHQWHGRTRASVERAIDYFTRAVERDPRAVDAWCGLADSWIVMGGRGYAPVAVAIERASSSATRALRVDDSLSSVHTSIGGANLLRRRWHDAETALRHAILLDPRNAHAHHWLSLALLSGFGDREAAMREQAISARLNPVSSMQVGALGWQRYLRGEYHLSRSNMEPAVDLNGGTWRRATRDSRVSRRGWATKRP